MNENGSGETQGVVEEQKDSHGRRGTIILDQYQPESPAESIVATQLDEIVVALGRKEDRNQRPVVLHRRQGYSPLSPSERRSWLQLCKGQDGTSNLDKSQPIDTEETIVATQLVGTVEVEKESGGSPSRTSGAPQEPGVFPTPSRGYERRDPPEQCSVHGKKVCKT